MMISTKKLFTKILTSLSQSWSLLRGTQITSGNLNNYTTIGNYYVISGSDAGNISNSPTTVAGYMLKVMGAAAGASYRTQLAIISGDRGDIYRRYYHPTNGWYDWHLITEEQVRNVRFLLNAAGSKDTTVAYGLSNDQVGMFLVSCCKYNNDTDANTGLYLIKLFDGTIDRSNVCAIKSASGVTVTADPATPKITVTTTTTYMAFSIVQVF